MTTIQADTLIREGVDEFRLAAAKTATGIIEQGLAVLKIKQGCETKQGGTDFPEVVMRELGLTESSARKYARIGEAAGKLRSRENVLPGESMTTLYFIAVMDEDTIADKIERGVIHPSATVAGVREKVTAQKSTATVSSPGEGVARTVTSTEEEVVNGIQGIVNKLSKAEVKALFKEVDEKVRIEREKAKKEAEQLRKDASRIRIEAERLRGAVSQRDRMLQYPLTKAEFRKIRGMLHPDKHPGNEARAKEAFEIFIRIEPICRKRDLKAVK